MSYLQGTNVVSKARRPRPDEHVLHWLAAQPLTNTYLSVFTLGELEKGIAALGDTGRAQALGDWLAQLTEGFGGRILDVDRDVATTWGRIRADAKRQGRPPPAALALLAATTITHALTLVTRDVAVLPVTVLNP